MNGQTNNFINFTRQILAGAKAAKNLSLSSLRKVFSLMGKREKIALGALLVIALISLLVSLNHFYLRHTTMAPANGGTYTEGMRGQPLYINPLLAYGDPDLSLTRLVFSGLYKFNNQGDFVPDLAEGMPQISTDQKQYTINLRRDAKWHNGKNVTADDVVYTIQTLKDQAFKSPLRNLWLTTSVEKLSDYQVKFTTKDISGPFIFNLIQPILPKSVWGKVDSQKFLLSENNLKAIGSGPYLIKEISNLKNGKVQSISLEAFSNYFGGRPKLDKLIVKFYDTDEDLSNALQGKEINGFGYTGGSNGQAIENASYQKYVVPLPQYQMLFFNLNNKILSDQNFRQDLGSGINQSELIEQVFQNTAAFPKLPLIGSGNSVQPFKPTFNLEAARQSLDKNGWTIDPKTNLRTKKGVTAELTLTTNDSPANTKTAQALAQNWQTLNLKINIKVLTNKEITDEVIRPRNFDILLYPQKMGADPDPFLLWHSSQTKDPGVNLTGFADQQADKLITEARTTTDIQTRNEKYQQFYDLLSQKLPAIFLTQAEYIYFADKEIKNINLSALFEPSQRFYDLPNWYINTRRAWK